MNISLHNCHPHRRPALRAVCKALGKWLRNPPRPPREPASRRRGGRGGFDIFLTTDREISKLHGRFLGDRRITDVMAFSEGNKGEVIISLDTAARQARDRKIPLKWELTILAVHGLLHLHGFRDHKFSDWKRMRVTEFEMMAKIL